MAVASTAGTPYSLPTLPVRRFTVAEYQRMIQTGILGDQEAVELLEGQIVPKMPHNPPHDAIVDQAREMIQARLPQGWRIRVQSAIATEDSQPEPDLAVVPGPATRYLDHHPTPPEIALVVEVADASLSRDRQEKLQIYARARLGCYWIINLVEGKVEVYTDPSGPISLPAYGQCDDFGLGTVIPLRIESNLVGEVPVAELLP
jgi:Uma2 family endonuclease